MEGFNAACSGQTHSKVRIGIVANNEDDCKLCDSRIGFGAEGYPDESNTCGNVAKHRPDNGDKYIETIGYIFINKA